MKPYTCYLNVNVTKVRNPYGYRFYYYSNYSYSVDLFEIKRVLHKRNISLRLPA